MNFCICCSLSLECVFLTFRLENTSSSFKISFCEYLCLTPQMERAAQPSVTFTALSLVLHGKDLEKTELCLLCSP